jgi:hypothetical protein
MKYNEKRKFASLLRRNTQKVAVFEALAAGFEPSVNEMTELGIADPRRVIQSLRSDHNMPIYLNKRTDRLGKVVSRFRLGTHRQSAM